MATDMANGYVAHVAKTTVDRYFAMWNEADVARRAEHIAQAWTDDGRYLDPMLEAQGHAELSEMVDGVQAQFPGCRFQRVSGIDVHHDAIRFAWELVDADGSVLAAGLDVGVLGSDGRLQSITGFFGELARAA
jgi:hypothetical protein